MHYVHPLLAIGLSISATLVSGQSPQCTFSMAAIGSPNDTTVEGAILENFENLTGQMLPLGQFSLVGPLLDDTLGNNCAVDVMSSQFYCAPATNGNMNAQFSIDGDGNLAYNGISNWLACLATGSDEDGIFNIFNIFSDVKADTTDCQIIALQTSESSCEALTSQDSFIQDPAPTVRSTSISSLGISASSSGLPSAFFSPSSSSSARSPSASTLSSVASTPSLTHLAPSLTSLSQSCPTDLSSGTFRFPILIIPTSPEAPDYSFGDSYVAYISPKNTTVFNFDVPTTSPYTGTCALLFLFPYESSLAVSADSFYFSGMEQEEGENGGLDFALLNGVAGPLTTYDTTPPVATDYGKTMVLPGNNYTIATFPCQSGTTSYTVSSVGNVELDYFQDSDPSPIGLYIVPCS